MSARVLPLLKAAQSVTVYRGGDLRAVAGVNAGDALSEGASLALDDVYRLGIDARRARLAISTTATGALYLAEDTGAGRSGNRLTVDCAVTFIGETGETLEALILAEDRANGARALYLMPFGRVVPGRNYTLAEIDTSCAREKLARVGAASYVSGTHITMADGRQVPVEHLRPGDMVLTRDSGARPVRWIGTSTHPASGPFAPVLIRAGALHNARDLRLSPDHRLFIYQRRDRVGAGRAELLVRARHLVNGTTITVDEGGHADYHQLLFDAPQIIFAEGIATESMLAPAQQPATLPRELAERLRRADAAPRQLMTRAAELAPPRRGAVTDVAALLRAASLG